MHVASALAIVAKTKCSKQVCSVHASSSVADGLDARPPTSYPSPVKSQSHGFRATESALISRAALRCLCIDSAGVATCRR